MAGCGHVRMSLRDRRHLTKRIMQRGAKAALRPGSPHAVYLASTMRRDGCATRHRHQPGPPAQRDLWHGPAAQTWHALPLQVHPPHHPRPQTRQSRCSSQTRHDGRDHDASIPQDRSCAQAPRYSALPVDAGSADRASSPNAAPCGRPFQKTAQSLSTNSAFDSHVLQRRQDDRSILKVIRKVKGRRRGPRNASAVGCYVPF